MSAEPETSAESASRFLALRSNQRAARPIAGATPDAERIRGAASSRGFVDGWKEVAVMLGRSERSCRTLAATSSDPLPVFKVGGIVRLLIADLDAWLARQRAAALGPARIEAPAIEEHW